MPSEFATKFVNQVYSDEKSKAIDTVNDALGSVTFDAIQKQKIEFAKQWGFNPDDTAQDVADEIEDSLPDNTGDDPQEEQPEAELETEPTAEPEQPEENETDS